MGRTSTSKCLCIVESLLLEADIYIVITLSPVYSAVQVQVYPDPVRLQTPPFWQRLLAQLSTVSKTINKSKTFYFVFAFCSLLECENKKEKPNS